MKAKDVAAIAASLAGSISFLSRPDRQVKFNNKHLCGYDIEEINREIKKLELCKKALLEGLESSGHVELES